MSGGCRQNLFGTQTQSEMQAKGFGLNGFTMIYNGMDQRPQNQNDINPVGMSWMPPMDDEYVVGNIAFVKKSGNITQEEIEKIYNKQQNSGPPSAPPGKMMCCTVL